MKRLHATLLILYIAICFAGLVIGEAWKVARQEWKHDQRNAQRRKASR